MTRPAARVALLIGSAGSCAMASYHFFIPYALGWGSSLDTLPPAIRWGSYSINFFMSYLMLAGGALTLIVWWRVGAGRPADRGIVVAMASFWVVKLSYQVVIPMPVPERLLLVRWGLIGFALVTAGAHVIALPALAALPGGGDGSCATDPR